MINPQRVKADVIEASAFPQLARQYGVRAVPHIVINDKIAFDGALPEEDFMGAIKEALEPDTQQQPQ